MLEKLAKFLCEEQQLRNRGGKFWNELSLPQKLVWHEEAERYIAHLQEHGFKIMEI
jgi:hypothetical protein